jgi:hypothetical protein
MWITGSLGRDIANRENETETAETKAKVKVLFGMEEEDDGDV